MPAQLVSLTDGFDILIDKPILLLGRHDECDIQLNSRKVSRKHCCIAQVGEKLIIRDLDSVNGVEINGQKVAEGVFTLGDELTIGNFRFSVRDSADAKAAPARLKVADELKKGKPAAAQKAAAQKLPEMPNVDELLEDCDEPVALDDHDKPAPHPKPVPRPLKKQPAPVPVPVPFADDDDDDSDPVLGIPSDIKLVPQSDVLPKDDQAGKS